ncbi:Integral membrane sensor signal transduction histidine kinase, partial [Acidiphilium sp. PM]
PGQPAILRTSGVRLAALGAAVAAMGAVIVFVVIYYGTLGSLRQTLDASITNEIGEILPQGPATPPAVAAIAIRAALAQAAVPHLLRAGRAERRPPRGQSAPPAAGARLAHAGRAGGRRLRPRRDGAARPRGPPA